MPAIKKPQDHLPAKQPQVPAAESAHHDLEPEFTDIQFPEPGQIEFNGHLYRIDYEAINDIEVLEAFQVRAGFLSGDLNGAIVALQKCLGPEYERLKTDYKQNHGGRMPATVLIQLFTIVNNQASGN